MVAESEEPVIFDWRIDESSAALMSPFLAAHAVARKWRTPCGKQRHRKMFCAVPQRCCVQACGASAVRAQPAPARARASA